MDPRQLKIEPGSGTSGPSKRLAFAPGVDVANARNTVLAKKTPLELPMNSLLSGDAAMNDPISMEGTVPVSAP